MEDPAHTEDLDQMKGLVYKEDLGQMEACTILHATIQTTPGALKSTTPVGRVIGAALLQEDQMNYKEVKEDQLIIQ